MDPMLVAVCAGMVIGPALFRWGRRLGPAHLALARRICGWLFLPLASAALWMLLAQAGDWALGLVPWLCLFALATPSLLLCGVRWTVLRHALAVAVVLAACEAGRVLSSEAETHVRRLDGYVTTSSEASLAGGYQLRNLRGTRR